MTDHVFICPPSSQPEDLFFIKSNRLVRRNDRRQVLVYVDGACSHNGLPYARAGWAVYVSPNTFTNGRLEPFPDGSTGGQTSNRAELRSAIVALGLKDWRREGFRSVVIASDSEYVVKGYCERIAVWEMRGWTTARGTPVRNRDLWEDLEWEINRLENKGVEVLFWRIPREWNLADEYAKEAVDLESD